MKVSPLTKPKLAATSVERVRMSLENCGNDLRKTSLKPNVMLSPNSHSLYSPFSVKTKIEAKLKEQNRLKLIKKSPQKQPSISHVNSSRSCNKLKLKLKKTNVKQKSSMSEKGSVPLEKSLRNNFMSVKDNIIINYS